MEKIKMSFARKFFKILEWAFFVLAALFILGMIIRWPYVRQKENTAAEVAKIHATKLTLDDVIGKNLPPDPGAEADKTIAGIDANNNGIRDDVELAIFKAYPDSAKTRAVLLQYALTLQMEFTQPIINTATVTEVVTENSRAASCVGDILVPRKSPESSRSTADVNKIYNYIDFVRNEQLNTDLRKTMQNNFLKDLGSYGNSTNVECDINVSTLPN
jgi:hypothetical protein